MSLIGKLFRRDKPSGKETQTLSDKEAIRQFRLGITSLVKYETPEVRAGLALQHVLILTACQCLEAVKQLVKTTDEKERSTKYYALASEFFAFLIHLVNRRMYSDYGDSIGEKWQNDLMPKYIEAFVKQWCVPHGPSEDDYRKIYFEFKDRLCSDLFHNANVAEADYAPCRGLLAEDNKIFTGDSLFSRLARNIAQMVGTENPIEQAMVYFSSFEIFLKTGFTDWINEAAQELGAKAAAA
jgi:hypothetical protein